MFRAHWVLLICVVTCSQHDSPKHYAEWKERDTKLVHLYETLDQANLWWKRHMSDCHWPWCMENGLHENGSGMFGGFWEFPRSYFWWCIFVKPHWTVHLQWVNFIVCKLVLIRTDFLLKYFRFGPVSLNHVKTHAPKSCFPHFVCMKLSLCQHLVI